MSGFVHVADGSLRDGDGRPVLLRGVGLGNWLLPEGYMWRFGAEGPDAPRQIEAYIETLVGPRRAAEFWTGFRDTFVTEADIAAIARAGFDHVRLPINSRTVMDDVGGLRPDGIAPVDRAVEWCRTHGLLVLLDLHGAPGGQTGTNIDDSPRGRPELFEVPRYTDQAVALWTALAARYADDPTVLGYDLLNEPLPMDWQHRYPDRLVALYRRLTAAIREVDRNHILMYEGTHWATNWEIFTEVWDEQSVLQFHKYWSPPDRPSIAGYLATGRRLGLPVYMGEGGENSPGWLATAFQLYEDEGVSWNFWPWKKVETRTSPWSVRAPQGWDAVLDHAAGRGPQPDPDQAWLVLSELVEACALARCEHRPEIENALFRRVPVELPAVAFGFRGDGVSWHSADRRAGSDLRADDAVEVRWTGSGEPDFALVDGTPPRTEERYLVRLEPGEWVAYHVRAESSAPVHLTLRCPAGRPTAAWDGTPVELTAGAGGGWHGLAGGGHGEHTIRVAAGDQAVELAAVVLAAPLFPRALG